MNLTYLYLRLRWVQLPAAVLMMLLQRTPLLRLLSSAPTAFGSPTASVLRSVFTVAAAMGAYDTLAGATQINMTTTSPMAATVGSQAGVGFTATGTGVSVSSWTFTGTIPPGMTFNSGATTSPVNTSTLTLSGTPTTAGSYTFAVAPWENRNGSGRTLSAVSFTINVTGVAVAAPTFTTQPTSASVTVGGSVTFTSVATGSGTITYQWNKDGAAISGATGASLTLTNVQTTAAGSYTVVATNSGGSTTSSAATLTVNAAVSAPTISTQPVSQTASAGSNIVLSVVATSSVTPTYQWRKNGATITGATSALLALSSITAADAGSYSVVVTNSGGSVTSSSAVLTVSSTVDAKIRALSVRTSLAASQRVTIGFVTEGGEKPVFLQASGPGLAAFLTGYHPDPQLEFYNSSSVLVASNDNWDASVAQVRSAVGALAVASGSKDAAILTSINGLYTAQIFGAGSGIVLIEAYDAGSGSAQRLRAVSARNIVGTGSDVLILGLVIDGTTNRKVLVRGVGAKLATFGVSGVLADPLLEVYDGSNTKIASNDSWPSSLASAFDSVGLFALDVGSKDAALSLSLPPGNYTIQVSGVGSTTGDAIAEVYELP